MSTNKSIIRRGNHFIFCNDIGWVLIDGPWFDKLEKRAEKLDGICSVLMARLVDSKTGWFDGMELPDDVVHVHYMRWQRISWHPGHITTVAEREKMDSWTQHILSLYEARRMRRGWIVQGRLPAFLNQIELDNEQNWDRLLQAEQGK
jgi:hypothetical protein